MSDFADLKNRFTYHAPKEDQPRLYEDIRASALMFAIVINNLCPDSREKALAFTKLEEAVFWANAAIAVRCMEANGAPPVAAK